jgi:hypothetical protein
MTRVVKDVTRLLPSAWTKPRANPRASLSYPFTDPAKSPRMK